MNYCKDCGNPSNGERCRACRHDRMREEALRQTQLDDDLLLEQVAAGVSAKRIATRYGISRTRAYQKIAEARRRQERREGR